MIYIYSSVLNMKVSRRDLLVQFTSRLEEHKCWFIIESLLLPPRRRYIEYKTSNMHITTSSELNKLIVRGISTLPSIAKRHFRKQVHGCQWKRPWSVCCRKRITDIWLTADVNFISIKRRKLFLIFHLNYLQ